MLISYAENTTSDFTNVVVTYSVWSIYMILLIFLSACCTHFLAPQAIGSGIAEMKTILRGVILKEYLTGKTLIAKMVGLTLALGSGAPIGKEGPFVHIASILANLLSYFVKTFHGIYANESRSSEMLAAACAVGVSSTFSAPVGGVLFSIEVTSVYFAVRNYWRGFFAAACSATLFRLFRVYLKNTEVTVVAFYQTYFPQEAFFPEELPVFALLGVMCGLLAAIFISLHRHMVLFLRSNKFAKSIFQKHWMVYPVSVALLVACLTYPKGFGDYLASDKRFSATAQDFLSNCTWTIDIIRDKLSKMTTEITKNNTLGNSTFINSAKLDGLKGLNPLLYNRAVSLACPTKLLHTWTGSDMSRSVFINLSCFLTTYFLLSALMSTLPIPCGLFGPTFIIGAGIGRLVGELMASWYVEGIRGLDDIPVYPGVYAVVGAAAFCGAVTHTISVAVIVFELTGQLLYILPVMMAVLIANAICSYMQPSIYDSIIQLKNLPYLPDIPQTSSNFHGIRVEQFMTQTVRFLSKQSTYLDAQNLLHNFTHLKTFPVVDNHENMILIGSVSRTKLLRALNEHVGPTARQREAQRRLSDALGYENFRLSDDRPHLQLSSLSRIDSAPCRFPITKSSNQTDAPVHKSSTKIIDLSSVSNDNTKKFTITSVMDDKLHPVQLIDAVTEFNARNSVGERSSRWEPFYTIYQKRSDISKEGFQLFADSVNKPIDGMENRDSVNLNQDIHDSTAQKPTVSKVPPISLTSSDNAITHNFRKFPRWNLFANGKEDVDTSGHHDVHATLGAMFRSITRISLGRLYKHSDSSRDLNSEGRNTWENEHLNMRIDFDVLGVDPAPFQLVEHSSLFKVHSLFSLLGLSRAYVTKCGRLVGVVALRDLRITVEKVQNGHLMPMPNLLTSYETEATAPAMALSGRGSITDSCIRRQKSVSKDEQLPSMDALGKKLPIITTASTEEDNELVNIVDSSKKDDMRNDLLTPCPEVLNPADVKKDIVRRRTIDSNSIKRPMPVLKEPLNFFGSLVTRSDKQLPTEPTKSNDNTREQPLFSLFNNEEGESNINSILAQPTLDSNVEENFSIITPENEERFLHLEPSHILCDNVKQY